MKYTRRRSPGRVAIAAAAVLTLGAGCDDQLRATVEDGIITSSTSLLAAFARALLNVGLEQPPTTDPNGG